MSPDRFPRMPISESQSALLSLRPAQPEDELFLLRLFGETQDQLALLRPNQVLWNTLVDIQYRGRKMTYSQHFPAAEDAILCKEDQPVGRLLIHHEAGCLRVVDIAVVAQLRGQGIGTWVLRQCQLQAADCGKRVELSVNPTNPALQLYERLGFRAVNDDPMNVTMVWSPA
jgi:GNAT superfamily N-acetyltransferase